MLEWILAEVSESTEPRHFQTTANHRTCSSRQQQQFIGAAAARRRRFGSVQQNFGLNHFSEIAELSATGTWNDDAGNRINHH